MNIIKYNTFLNEDRIPILVKESTKRYPVKELDNPQRITDMMNCMYNVKNLSEEFLWCLSLDTKCKLKGIFEISHGLINASLVSPREVFMKLCLSGATSFVIVHNHPSGNSFPSKEDVRTTDRLAKCGDLMNIKLIDHIIIGNEYYSLAENGFIQS